MLKRVCLAAAILTVAATPAFADNNCGMAPIAPAVPGASDLSGKTVEAGRVIVIDAYHQVKAYQAALKPYRECLKAVEDNAKTSLADAQTANDKDKMAKARADAEGAVAAENKTVDTETQVATDFNTLHVAQCVHDTDPKICPKK